MIGSTADLRAAVPRRTGLCRERRAPAGAALGLAVALAGCGANYASSDPSFPGGPEARHPIVLTEAPRTLDVYPTGGVIDARARADLRAFAGSYKRLGEGEIAVLAPGRRNAEARAVGQIRSALRGAGLGGRISVGSYLPDVAASAAPIKVEFVGLKAEVKSQCGQWPEDLASGSSLWGWKNEPYYNFGCATQSMLAAQVDDPRDFVEQRALGPSDVAMRMRAIEAVRRGQDPGTAWSTGLTPIGTVGGSGGGG
ncbi:MAG TPA: CpaD family pilus assembly protein [Roseiarcus sp.]|nr:CpaD family pilus assembly protein [Roseiarcus sp.]